MKVRPIAASRDFPAIARLFVGFRTATASGILLEMETYWRRSGRLRAGWISVPDNTLSTSHRYDVLFGPAMTPRCLSFLPVWRTVCLLAFGAINQLIHKTSLFQTARPIEKKMKELSTQIRKHNTYKQTRRNRTNIQKELSIS